MPSTPAADAPIRGTQSFVHTLSDCWRRPSLTAMEVAWRWLYGIPALALVFTQLKKIALAATDGTLDPARLGLDKPFLADPVGTLSADPLGTVARVTAAFLDVAPAFGRVALWLLPTLALAWILLSAIGRSLILRRAAPAAASRIPTLMALQAIRTLTLAAIFYLWVRLILACGAFAVTRPIAHNQDPNLILYCALVIVLSLTMFVAWGFVSWILTAAPILAQVRDLGPAGSLRAALHLGPLKSKLAEINLVLGIVKIALIILAMVFSATPLPFQDVTTPGFLACWWAGVSVLYLLWSDFFHVARLLGYLNLYRTYAPADEK